MGYFVVLSVFFSFILGVIVFYFIFRLIKKSFLCGDISLTSSVSGVFLFSSLVYWLLLFVCGIFFLWSSGGGRDSLGVLLLAGPAFTVSPFIVIALSIFTFFSLKKMQKDVIVTDSNSFIKKYFKYLLIVSSLFFIPLVIFLLYVVYVFLGFFRFF